MKLTKNDIVNSKNRVRHDKGTIRKALTNTSIFEWHVDENLFDNIENRFDSVRQLIMQQFIHFN